MNTIEHAHAAIIALTQYESAQYHGETDAAREHLLDTMRHIIAITRQTPAAPEYRPPSDLGRPERVCRYLRTINYLADVLPIPGVNMRYHNHIANAWLECVALCEHHGWMPPDTLAGILPPLAQWKPERVTVRQERPLLSQMAAPARR